jgi:hypothetical protein
MERPPMFVALQKKNMKMAKLPKAIQFIDSMQCQSKSQGHSSQK